MHSLFLLTVILLFASNVTAEVLKRVEVIGNKRTTKSAIIQTGKIKIGQELSQEELVTIKENLGRIGQIRIIRVDFSDGILTIVVIDKWTLIPIPMFTKSGSYHNRGLVLYEDNFLGSLGTLAPGVSWSNSLFNFLLYYQDESLFSPEIGIKFLLMRKSDYSEFKKAGRLVDAHETRYDSYFITPNYLYKDHVFKAGPVYIDKSIYRDDVPIARDISKGIFFRHHWNAYQILEVMYDGMVTTFDLYALKQQNGRVALLSEANVSWSVPVDDNFLNFGVHGALSSEKSYLFAKNLGGDEGFRGHDKASFPTWQNLGGLAQYQRHLFNRLYLSPFYEYNNSKLITPILHGKRLSENTMGMGLRYYFKKISIPAVIFDAARNIEDKSTHFHINIGLSI
ncbi:MAG: hypothetical protein A2X86_10875 [Bdellovibrionales bacterium GWA2_49_15]|nr:MAG: hypothetical protein A2X86_10875 [Bdellovibrionales bacterium GWA2_49_15]HAZ11479.1 hypothetical protein [Bdellovibrionales bacterium]